MVVAGLGDALFANFNPLACGKYDVHDANLLKLFEDASRFIAQSGSVAHAGQQFPLAAETLQNSVFLVFAFVNINGRIPVCYRRLFASGRNGFLNGAGFAMAMKAHGKEAAWKARGRENDKPRKGLSADALFTLVREGAEKIPDDRPPDAEVSLPDALMSAFAMFSLKDPSLLAFDQRRNDENLKFVYHIENIPCDTYLPAIPVNAKWP